MTNRCEFGLGNGGFARVAMGTVSGSNPLAVAVQMQTRRRQRKRTQCSTVSSMKEGRASANYAKTITASLPEVHLWRHFFGVTAVACGESHTG